MKRGSADDWSVVESGVESGLECGVESGVEAVVSSVCGTPIVEVEALLRMEQVETEIGIEAETETGVE